MNKKNIKKAPASPSMLAVGVMPVARPMGTTFQSARVVILGPLVKANLPEDYFIQND